MDGTAQLNRHEVVPLRCLRPDVHEVATKGALTEAALSGTELGSSFPMFAIVKTGGKQYRIGAGDQITVERIVGDVGSEVSLSEVLAIEDAGASTIGRPTVA